MSPEEVSEGWREDGHELVGKRCLRVTLGEDSSRNFGTVAGWLPCSVDDPFLDAAGEPAPLFKVVFDKGLLKGEREDLE